MTRIMCNSESFILTSRRTAAVLHVRAVFHQEADDMATAEVLPGICGLRTTVEAHKADDDMITLTIQSECKAIQRLAAVLTEVNPYREMSFRREGPLTMQLAAKHCSHAACPVPVGIIKAVEVEAGLALPADVSIKISK
jgi:hypothetical protein